MLLTVVGTIVSPIFAIFVVWYSKKNIAKTMTRRHILHLLKAKNMNGKELIDTAKECRSEVISPKLIPILLVRLEEEGLIQKAANNRYTTTTNGLESLQSIDAMAKEFQKVAKIMRRTSMIGKFMTAEALDRISMLSIDNTN